MSNRPGDHIAVSLEIAFAPLVGSEDTCNVSCDGGLFGQDRNGTGFNCFHRNLSLPSSSAECAFEAISKLKLREGPLEDDIITLARKKHPALAGRKRSQAQLASRRQMKLQNRWRRSTAVNFDERRSIL